MKRIILIGAGFGALVGCAVANQHPPVGLMDAPAIEFRNAAGQGRWCTSPDAPGVLSGANYRACRDELLASGYREIGPWCGGAPPTSGETAAAVLLGGVSGAITSSVRASHHANCQQRQQQSATP